MGVDNGISSPHKRSQQGPFTSSPLKKFAQNDISCSALIERHRFLLTALVLLVLLCAVYLYFAVTLGSDESCHGLLGTEKELCLVKQVKQGTFTKGRLKLF